MPVRPFIDWDRKICITPLGDRLRAAGTAEFAGDDATLWPARWQAILQKMLEVFPALRDAKGIEPWAGFRPMTPDHVPILGSTRYRSEEHTSELQSLMRISYAVFCLKKK